MTVFFPIKTKLRELCLYFKYQKMVGQEGSTIFILILRMFVTVKGINS